MIDQKQAKLDFKSVGFMLLEPIALVKSPVKSRCLTCGIEVSQNYLQVKNRIKRNTGLMGCRKCFKRRDDADVEQILLDAGLQPIDAYPGAGVPWKFRCTTCGEVSSRRLSQIQTGKGCPICGQRNRVDPRWVSSSEAVEDFRLANLKPLDPYPGKATVKWRATCLRCNREVSPKLREVRAGQGGCKFCARTAQAATRRRSEVEVRQLFSDSNLVLLSSYESNRKTVEARCSICSKSFSLRVSTVEDGLGCPYCNQRRVDPVDAIAVMKGFGLEPLEPYPGSPQRKWKCRCTKCESIVTPRFSSARHGIGICPHCSGKVVDVAKAVELMRTRGLEPLVDFPGSVKPWLCKCVNCNRETSPAYNSIYSKAKGGCKWCADKGINYQAPSIVYLITNDELGAHKIGIAAQTSQRMKAHKRNGWQTFKTLKTEDGYIAKKIEDDVLNWWRSELGLGHFLLPEQMPQGGFTETADSMQITLVETWEKVLKYAKKHD